MVTWYAIIRLVDTGARQRVTVQADSYSSARQMLESLYGRDAVVSGPRRVDLMRGYLTHLHAGEVGVQGQRASGGFILITGQDGVRYALRPNQVAVVHDADEWQDETILHLHRGHVVRLPCSLEEVLNWLGP
jgi:hypothetical protein